MFERFGLEWPRNEPTLYQLAAAGCYLEAAYLSHFVNSHQYLVLYAELVIEGVGGGTTLFISSRPQPPSHSR